MTKTAEILIHPQFQLLKDEIAKVKQDIVDILFEYEYITLQVNKRIEHEYAIRIGCWEKRKLEEHINALKAKRKLALAQQAANQNRAMDEDLIEEILDKELASWNAQLTNVCTSFLNVISEESKREIMSDSDAKELFVLYRKLMKRLHPDLLRNPTDQQARLFLAAQEAFEAGDLLTLRAIEAATSSDKNIDFDADNDGASSVEQQNIELLANETTKNLVVGKLEQLKQEFPYCFKSQLADMNWVKETVSTLQDNIKSNMEATKRYTERYLLLVEKQKGEQ